ncbi:Transposon TX1 uncharacterized 149 kDa protein [Vitis vinifera]|uniref:Transposon TX1 uncharacterized 149 kDa protein n=1 Tax=Vitis vinifera TaxID=29760 RepID=A0A438DHJ0_VITVI|nr:Transposon TX1 uncharacterized 149 kDa protein [Vitis vinifera]
MSQGVIHSLGVGRFLGWGAVNARGAAGGVVVFWDKRVLELVSLEVGIFSISCRFKNCEDGFMWFFTGVYEPTMKRFPSERSRVGRLSGSMRRFSEVLDELTLRDLPLQGGPYTWSGGLNGQSRSRLDRFLISEDWENHFSGVSQCTLPRPVSDHAPILLDGGGVRRGPIPFRFENMWMKEEGFKDLLKGWWQGFNFNGSYSFVLSEKLKALKERQRRLNEQELEARKKAKEEFKKWASMEEISWRQKSRQIWLKEGDKNTGFFHKMANSNSRRNCLKKIKVSGICLLEDQDIQRGVVRAYQDLLSDPGGWHPSMSSLEFDRIGREEAARLEKMFSLEEVYLALSELNGDKAPGPDGFPIAFSQFCWDFVKDEIMGFFKDFFERGKFIRSVNSTFLVLVPKKGGAEDLRDYRPISLVGGLYKILAKVLANRLKKVVSKVVSSSQNAFVEGRQILDAALIANKAIDSLLKGDEAGVLCKLDLEKAYDHINWDFLMSVMQKMGFGEKWVGWIRWCITTASFSVLINGSPTGFFQSTRGLRQGDPISPYLFVLGMEALSCLINKAVRGGFLSGCRLRGRGGNGIQVSHLLFADDTLVFCKDSQDQMDVLSWLLMWFEAISGLNINLEKSEILPVGRVENAEVLASELGCKVGSLPSTYLGLPLGVPHKSVVVWDGVEERMRKRLALWKRQFISKGGESLSFGALWLACRSILWDGRRVKFWKDIWCGNIPLSEAFPSLFAFAVSQDAWVADCWDSMGDAGGWHPCFSRSFNDWELEAVASLLSVLQGKRLNAGLEIECPVSMENHMEPLRAY